MSGVPEVESPLTGFGNIFPKVEQVTATSDEVKESEIMSRVKPPERPIQLPMLNDSEDFECSFELKGAMVKNEASNFIKRKKTAEEMV